MRVGPIAPTTAGAALGMACALGCGRAPVAAPPAAELPPFGAPVSVVADGDLLFDPSRSGGDGLRGFGGIHGVWLGQRALGEAGAACRQAHELRVGALELPWAQWCTVDGQLIAVRAWQTSSGRSIDLGEVVSTLERRLGEAAVRGGGPNWVWRWDGDEVVVSLRMIEGVRLELEAALTPEAAPRAFQHWIVGSVDDLDTRPSVLLEHGDVEAMSWAAFVRSEVPAPRVGCRLEPIPLGPLKARFWYSLFQPPMWVPVVYGTAWIPWRTGTTGGVLVVDGYEPVEILWGDPGTAEWTWCDDRIVPLVAKEPGPR